VGHLVEHLDLLAPGMRTSLTQPRPVELSRNDHLATCGFSSRASEVHQLSVLDLAASLPLCCVASYPSVPGGAWLRRVASLAGCLNPGPSVRHPQEVAAHRRFAAKMGTSGHGLGDLEPWRDLVVEELEREEAFTAKWFTHHSADLIELKAAQALVAASSGTSLDLEDALRSPGGPLDGLAALELDPALEPLLQEVLLAREQLPSSGPCVVVHSECLAATLELDDFVLLALSAHQLTPITLLLPPPLAPLAARADPDCLTAIPTGEPPEVLEVLARLLSDGSDPSGSLEVARALAA
jgi:hypothetical protein